MSIQEETFRTQRSRFRRRTSSNRLVRITHARFPFRYTLLRPRQVYISTCNDDNIAREEEELWPPLEPCHQLYLQNQFISSCVIGAFISLSFFPLWEEELDEDGVYLLGKFFLETPGGAPNEEVEVNPKRRRECVLSREDLNQLLLLFENKKKGGETFLYIRKTKAFQLYSSTL